MVIVKMTWNSILWGKILWIEHSGHSSGVNSYWAIPENIHTIPWTASLFYPPPALRISKMGYHTIPLEFHSHQTTPPPHPHSCWCQSR